MSRTEYRYVYGPVPSRRLGRSLGVDLIPFKICSYDCIYCQLGRTTNKTTELNEHAPMDGVLAELRQKLRVEPDPDFIGLAGSGEPTLHSRIAELVAERLEVSAPDRVVDLVGLLDGVGRDRGEVLFQVPRAARLAISEPRHDLEESLDLAHDREYPRSAENAVLSRA